MKRTNKMVLSAVFLALGLTLPFLTMQIKEIGNTFLPMHLPVLLCGIFCGGGYGAAIGFLVPLLRSALFSMPPMYPTAICMAFELCTYGLVIGLMYGKREQKSIGWLYASLVIAMVLGRIVWGVVSALARGLGDTPFTMKMFLGGAFLDAIPGIIIQLVLIPVLVQAVQKFNKNKRKL